MQMYGSILPGAAALTKLLPQQAAQARREAAAARSSVRLSQTAQHRLKVIRWYEAHGRNVTRTANHFSHSRTSIQSWLKRYQAAGLAGLEDKSHRPHNVRKPSWPRELAGCGKSRWPDRPLDKAPVHFRKSGSVQDARTTGTPGDDAGLC